MQMTRYTGPSYSQSGSSSTSYDYAGLDEHIKRQDALGAARDEKFNALYSGDVQAGVGAGNRIRDLLKAVRAHAPGADERDPHHIVNPLVRISSTSGSSSMSGDSGSGEFMPEAPGVEPQVPPANAALGRRPNRFAGQV
jgi:hypothetical protein